uniref:C2H2-type domain-containing protein n=1 Tax=Lates calcarifer TaxID=8187 RepID=A0A4W6DTL2_LATCA
MCDQLKTCDSPSSLSEESRLTSMAAQGGPVPRGVSPSKGPSDTLVCGQIQPKNVNIDLIREKYVFFHLHSTFLLTFPIFYVRYCFNISFKLIFRAALLKMKGKFVVNEKRLLQLFSCKCPLCGCKLQMEKVTYGVLIVLNQHCLQCEYRNQWKSQVNAIVPPTEDVTPESVSVDGDHSSVTAVAVINKEEDHMDETEESGDDGDEDSDEDWNPTDEMSLAKGLHNESDEETEDDFDDYPPLPVKYSQLCTECGMFFNKRKPHTCEHKIKPYSCNICGKRCVSEVALNSHSRVHDESYEHRCKYCHVTFKTKVDKITHQQIHVTQGKPYKCPDCSETFATNTERRVHLEVHRGPKQLKCHICGIEFNHPRSLQRHLVVHTGVRPYKCSMCQRGFNQAGHLKSHMRLHTGERPFKCQHCDKCFNHNVSLKSHVQRYHASASGCGRKRGKVKKTVSDPNDDQENVSRRGADSELDNGEEERDKEETVEEERIDLPQRRTRSTSRPIGRPKRNAAGSLELAREMQGLSSRTRTRKSKMQKSKRTHCSDEESEDEPTESDFSSDLKGEEEERSERGMLSTSRSRGRPKMSDNDSNFQPQDSKKKRRSRQSSGKSSGKRRGRPRKNQAVEDT